MINLTKIFLLNMWIYIREASLFKLHRGTEFSGGGAENWRRGLGGGKLASRFRGGKKIFLFQSQFNRYILDLNRHVHSTLILWLYSGYIAFIHDIIVEYVTCQCRAEIYFRSTNFKIDLDVLFHLSLMVFI